MTNVVEVGPSGYHGDEVPLNQSDVSTEIMWLKPCDAVNIHKWVS